MKEMMSRTINFSIDDGEILIMRDKVNAANLKGSTIKIWLNNDTPYEFNYENKEEAKEDFAKLKRYLNGEKEWTTTSLLHGQWRFFTPCWCARF